MREKLQHEYLPDLIEVKLTLTISLNTYKKLEKYMLSKLFKETNINDSKNLTTTDMLTFVLKHKLGNDIIVEWQKE